MESPNLLIIGTSHIARQSVQEVTNAIEQEKPDIVAVELDSNRLYGLTHKVKSKITFYDIRRIGIQGFFFALLGGWLQKKLGNLVGVDPGSEMLTAVKLAKKNNIPIALIDRDIEITLRRFSMKLTWKEKFRFFADIFNMIFFRKREMKKFGLEEIDLAKVPGKETIKKLLNMTKKRYPNVYEVLVEERNRFMAKNLSTLILRYPEKKIIAVMGAGHEEELFSLVLAELKRHSSLSQEKKD